VQTNTVNKTTLLIINPLKTSMMIELTIKTE